MRGNVLFGRERCDSFSEGIHLRIDCEGNQTYLAVRKDWLLLTNHSPTEANKRYKQRWKIEEMFQFLKKRGFNLEDTHFKSPKKLVTLINLLSLTVLFLLQFVPLLPKLKLKKHGYPPFSLIRQALDYVLHHLASIFNSS